MAMYRSQYSEQDLYRTSHEPINNLTPGAVKCFNDDDDDDDEDDVDDNDYDRDVPNTKDVPNRWCADRSIVNKTMYRKERKLSLTIH